jgi:predicted secreted protein
MAMRQRTALAVAVAVPVAFAALAGTAAASTTHAGGGDAAAVPVARKPGPPVPTVTLTAADNGRSVRLRRGEDLLVLLQVDPGTDPTTWWRPIDETGGSLSVLPQTAMSMRGTTAGRYRAVARGEAALSSVRSVCAQHGTGPTCHSMQGWHVTVEVR